MPRCPRQIPGPFGGKSRPPVPNGPGITIPANRKSLAGQSTSVTESAGRIRAGLARRYGPCLVLLEHHLAPESGAGMQTIDLVRIGADGSPHWSRVWPTRRRTRGTPGWNGGWPLTDTRSPAGPRAGPIGVTALTADC